MDEATWTCGTPLTNRPDVLRWLRAVVASADENDIVTFPEAGAATQQLILGMLLKHWIRPRDYLRGGPYVVTSAGRSALEGSDHG